MRKKDKESMFENRKGRRKKRKENVRKTNPNKYLIVCEGEKTEPNYFRYFQKKIEDQYKNAVIDVQEKISLDIEGTGRNTKDLVDYTKKLINRSSQVYGKVWVVFDKDDFSDEQFNTAIDMAESEGYGVAWSNESFELWYLLHFQSLSSALRRDEYIVKLNENYKKLGMGNVKYEKSDDDIMSKLNKGKGGLSSAIKRSKKLVDDFEGAGIYIPSKMNPATKVYLLVEELLGYIK